MAMESRCFMRAFSLGLRAWGGGPFRRAFFGCGNCRNHGFAGLRLVSRRLGGFVGGGLFPFSRHFVPGAQNLIDQGLVAFALGANSRGGRDRGGG